MRKQTVEEYDIMTHLFIFSPCPRCSHIWDEALEANDDYMVMREFLEDFRNDPQYSRFLVRYK